MYREVAELRNCWTTHTISLAVLLTEQPPPANPALLVLCSVLFERIRVRQTRLRARSRVRVRASLCVCAESGGFWLKLVTTATRWACVGAGSSTCAHTQQTTTTRGSGEIRLKLVTVYTRAAAAKGGCALEQHGGANVCEKETTLYGALLPVWCWCVTHGGVKESYRSSKQTVNNTCSGRVISQGGSVTLLILFIFFIYFVYYFLCLWVHIFFIYDKSTVLKSLWSRK